MRVKVKSILEGQIQKELYKSKVVLYGAGISGERILTLLKPYCIDCAYVIDDDPSRWGNRIEDIEIISFDEFVEKCLNFTKVSVILATIYGKTVLKRLEGIADIVDIEVYEMYAWMDEAYDLGGLKDKLSNKGEIERFNKEKVLLKERMADEESKKVLDGLYNYMNSKDFNIISDICTEYDQYFIPEIRSAIHQPLKLIDGGAYTGGLYQAIKKYDIKLERWYCFEADTNNFKQLLVCSERLKLGKTQVCVNKGLWKCADNLYFEYEKGSDSKIVDYKTEVQIETVSIDTYFSDCDCNFIKMDIEGAEYFALQGAMQVIKRDRPILAISIYHSIEDFYRIPKYLMDELCGYKFYVRHHALICCETVLYAIPDEY